MLATLEGYYDDDLSGLRKRAKKAAKKAVRRAAPVVRRAAAPVVRRATQAARAQVSRATSAAKKAVDTRVVKTSAALLKNKAVQNGIIMAASAAMGAPQAGQSIIQARDIIENPEGAAINYAMEQYPEEAAYFQEVQRQARETIGRNIETIQHISETSSPETVVEYIPPSSPELSVRSGSPSPGTSENGNVPIVKAERGSATTTPETYVGGVPTWAIMAGAAGLAGLWFMTRKK